MALATGEDKCQYEQVDFTNEGITYSEHITIPL